MQGSRYTHIASSIPLLTGVYNQWPPVPYTLPIIDRKNLPIIGVEPDISQVTRCLAAKVFRGLQVCCSARTSAQFDEQPRAKVRSVIFAQPPSENVRKTEAMDMTSQKAENAEEGRVGGTMCRP